MEPHPPELGACGGVVAADQGGGDVVLHGASSPGCQLLGVQPQTLTPLTLRLKSRVEASPQSFSVFVGIQVPKKGLGGLKVFASVFGGFLGFLKRR